MSAPKMPGARPVGHMDAAAGRRPYAVRGPSAGFVREPESAEVDWRHAAACLDQDPELFFPIGETGPALLQIEEAKDVCRRCPSIDACLQWSLESGQSFGVWGGMSEGDRSALKRKAARKRAKERGEEYVEEPDPLRPRMGEPKAGNGSEAPCGAEDDPDGPDGRESAPQAATPPLSPETAALDPSPSPAIADAPVKEASNA